MDSFSATTEAGEKEATVDEVTVGEGSHEHTGMDHTEQEGYAADISQLFNAVIEGNGEMVSSLLDGGVPVNARNKESCTPLLAAAAVGHYQIVNDLLNRGARVDLGTASPDIMMISRMKIPMAPFKPTRQVAARCLRPQTTGICLWWTCFSRPAPISTTRKRQAKPLCTSLRSRDSRQSVCCCKSAGQR